MSEMQYDPLCPRAIPTLRVNWSQRWWHREYIPWRDTDLITLDPIGIPQKFYRHHKPSSLRLSHAIHRHFVRAEITTTPPLGVWHTYYLPSSTSMFYRPKNPSHIGNELTALPRASPRDEHSRIIKVGVYSIRCDSSAFQILPYSMSCHSDASA